MNGNTPVLKKFFTVFLNKQTYLNIFYLLLAFPLGIAYFVFLVTGFSLGLGLLITLIGIPILLMMILGCWGLSIFERELAIYLLDVKVPPMSTSNEPDQSIFGKLKKILSNSVTWKGLVYLFAKFPIGIATFVVSVTLISTSAALLTAPFTYKIDGFEIIKIGSFHVDSFGEALFAMIAGLFISLISMHAMNILAFILGRFAYIMLGSDQHITQPPMTNGSTVSGQF